VNRVAGAERQVLLLAGGLVRREWRVSVVALSGSGGDSAKELRAQGAEFFTLEMRKGLADPRGWLRFHRWLDRERPDVVHAHLPHATWLARWSRLISPLPVVIDSVHTSNTGGPGRRFGYRLSRWLPDRVCGVSDGVAGAYRSAGMVSRSSLAVLPNGVDVERWRPDPAARCELRRRLGFTNEFLWFAAGRLDPVKDYPTLLRAMMEVPKSAHLVIAGGGPEEGPLRELAIQLGIESRVRFLGFKPDVVEWMQAADAFVLASRWEGLPLSLLEAGACGLPAVATDVAGSREVVVNGETGLLATSGGPFALRAAMNRMMRLDAGARSEMGEKARRRIVERYSLESVLDRWEGTYRELLARHPRPARWARPAPEPFHPPPTSNRQESP
jgi:glycosyltransferase involved in cell wall biosynthesis